MDTYFIKDQEIYLEKCHARYMEKFGKSVDLYNRLDKIYRRFNPNTEKGAEFWCRVSRIRSKLSGRLQFIAQLFYPQDF